jgi:hypothetical protein
LNLIKSALDAHSNANIEYFKIGALKSVGTTKLIFVVSEYGKTFEERTRSSLLMTGSLVELGGELALDASSPLTVHADISEQLKGITGKELVISGLDYNARDGKIYFLTEFSSKQNTRTTQLWALNFGNDENIDSRSLAIGKFVDNSSAAFRSNSLDLTFVSDDRAIITHEATDLKSNPIDARVGEVTQIKSRLFTLIKLIKYPGVKF